MSSSFGKNYRISIFGESHSAALGINIEGIPPGTELDLDFIRKEMKRRAPGRTKLSTLRKEEDEFEILSGFFEGKATGTPLGVIIRNKDQKSKDYNELKIKPRPSHGDWSGLNKYRGYNDIRGGGHFSGRITAPIVLAGAIAKKILEKEGIFIFSHIKSLKDIEDVSFLNKLLDIRIIERLKGMILPTIDEKISEKMEEIILKTKEEKDSLGGTIELMVEGIKPGIGDPFFESLESEISRMIFSIPSIKGIEFGSGFEITKMKGSQANDQMYFNEEGEVKSYTNNNGGIIGGITTGMPIIFSVAVKPTPSIAKEQKTVDLKTNKNTVLEIIGRHDPVIIPRIIPVLESATAIVILDRILEAKKYLY